MCTIQPSPGDFPRGRPAPYLSAPYLFGALFFGALALEQAGRRRSVWRRGPPRTLRRVLHQLPPDVAICSAKGCRAPARYALRWNNPKLHEAQRRKTWLACPTHRTTLADFLDARGFLREVDELP